MYKQNGILHMLDRNKMIKVMENHRTRNNIYTDCQLNGH